MKLLTYLLAQTVETIAGSSLGRLASFDHVMSFFNDLVYRQRQIGSNVSSLLHAGMHALVIIDQAMHVVSLVWRFSDGVFRMRIGRLTKTHQNEKIQKVLGSHIFALL